MKKNNKASGGLLSLLAQQAQKNDTGSDADLKYDKQTFGHLVRYQVMMREKEKDAVRVKKFEEDCN